MRSAIDARNRAAACDDNDWRHLCAQAAQAGAVPCGLAGDRDTSQPKRASRWDSGWRNSFPGTPGNASRCDAPERSTLQPPAQTNHPAVPWYVRCFGRTAIAQSLGDPEDGFRAQRVAGMSTAATRRVRARQVAWTRPRPNLATSPGPRKGPEAFRQRSSLLDSRGFTRPRGGPSGRTRRGRVLPHLHK